MLNFLLKSNLDEEIESLPTYASGQNDGDERIWRIWQEVRPGFSVSV